MENIKEREKDKVVIRNYNKVYTLEQKIYTLGNWRLPNPVEMVPAIAFVTMATTMFIINRSIVKIPIPGPIQYVILPYLIASKITKTKKDGKKLFKYYMDYVTYLFQKGTEIERFEKVEKIKEIQFFK